MSWLAPIIGVWRVARGRADGMSRFGASSQSFLASLAPLIAFPLAGALLLLVREGPVSAATLLAVTLVAQLSPPVLSFELASRWGAGPRWLHYATAYNWCYWALPVMAVLLMTLFGMSMTLGGVPEMAAAQGVVLALAAYSLWLHWFLARHALALSRIRAAVLVALVNSGTLLLAFGPRFLV